MEPRAIVVLAITGIAVAVLVRYRHELEEALRRGPWNGGGPPPTGPAVAADPFWHRFTRKKREPAHHY